MNIALLVPGALEVPLTHERRVACLAFIAEELPPALRSLPDLDGLALLERELLIDALKDDLVELICTPGGRRWLADLAAGFRNPASEDF